MSRKSSAETMSIANNLSWMRSYYWERASVDQLVALWETIRKGESEIIGYFSYIFDLFTRVNSSQTWSLPDEKWFLIPD
jgi:hypothetical protein